MATDSTVLGAQSPAVNYVRVEVSDLKPRWDLVKDCCAGSAEIKKQGRKYLPQPNESDKSEANTIRYLQYLERAIFYNVTGKTAVGLVGQVFATEPTAEIPPELDVFKQDADGGGVSLEQMARNALMDVLKYGRLGCLVDYPPTDAPASKADIATGKIRPFLTLWKPWDIINWRTVTIGGQKLLSLVVISEQFVGDDDGFNAQLELQFRVLRLTADQIYTVEIWQITDDKAAGYQITQTYVPLNADGLPWRFIPFTFIGAQNNDPTPDLPPLYDMAILNIGHYRNSADFEETVYMVGQPTPWASGLSEEWVKDVMKGSMALGSRAVIPLPVGGACGMLEVQPNSLARDAMQDKQAQMLALGAKLLDPGTVQQTATEAIIDDSAATSVLASCACNVSKAFSAALLWAYTFATATDADPESIEYCLNTDFGAQATSFNDRAQAVAEWQANAISTSELRAYLAAAGIATLDLEDYQAEIDAAGPSLGTPIQQQQLDAQATAAAAKAAALKKGQPQPNDKPPAPAGS